MKWKRLLWIASLLIAIMAAIWLFGPSEGAISRTAYGRIKLGMTKDNVLAIMQFPPGAYTTEFHTSVSEESEGQPHNGERFWWTSNDAMIDVEFDEREEVCWKSFHAMETERSLHQQLRRFWWSIKSWF
jgi:hypothetical protein